MKLIEFLTQFLLIFTIFSLINSLDNSTLSNYEDIPLNMLSGDFKIDFENKIVHGNLSYKFTPKKDGNKIILDTKNLNILKIYKITEADGEKAYEAINFTFGEIDENLGTPLIISVNYTQNNNISIRIEYNTTKEGAAAQFLTEEQTFGKSHPYFFTQSALIIGRSLLPCQDTPAVKFEFDLSIIVPKDLRGMISGIYQGEENYTEEYKKYNYKQIIPVPSYLVSLAAGNIVNKSITGNINVFSEPEYIEEAYNEIAKDLPIALNLSIDYMGPYEWGQYNILVLPRSFPYSGMENPCLSFLSPCLINGDKSLISIIFHEMIHSWSGNLVTNENWSDFWLNEGITMFLQRKIVGLWMNDKEYARLDGLLGQFIIQEWIDYYGEDYKDFTTLRPNMTGYNPDEFYSDIPYEKGYNFIYYIEYLIGEEKLEKFFKSYFEHFKYKSIDYYQFKDYFLDFCGNNNITEEILNKINWTAWIFTPGDIPIQPPENNSYKIVADEIVEKIKNESFDNLDSEFNKMLTVSKVYILSSLWDVEGFLSDKQHKFLTETLGLYKKQNFLISVNYFQLILEKTDKFLEHELDSLIEFLSNYGAADYMVGIYESFYKRDEIKAQETLDNLKSFYHRRMLDMALQEIEYCKEEFPILELNVNKDKIFYYPYEDMFELNVSEYKNDLGELILENNIYLILDDSTKLELNCYLKNESNQYCKLKDDKNFEAQGQFSIKVIERTQKMDYAVKIFESNKFEIKQILNKIDKTKTKTSYEFDINKENELKIILNLNENINFMLPVYFIDNNEKLNLKCDLNGTNYECILNKTFCETFCNKGKGGKKKFQINVLSKSEKSFLDIDFLIKCSEDEVSILAIVLPCVIGGIIIIGVIFFYLLRSRKRKSQMNKLPSSLYQLNLKYN